MSEKIIIEFDLLEEDYKRMCRFASWEAPYLKSRRQKIVLIILLIVAFLLAFIIQIDVEAFNNEFLLKFSIIFLLITVPLLAGSNNKIGNGIDKNTLRVLSLPENKNILGNKYFEIDAEKIFARESHITSNLSWSAVTKINISDIDFYLYLDSMNAILIPKRVFKTIEERNIFENLLRSKMPVTDYRTQPQNE